MQCQRAVLRAAATSVVVLAFGTVGAAPVVFVEGPDLSAAAPLTTFAFDIGTNTVSGVTATGDIVDLDSFAFTIPSGAVLVSAQVQFSALPGNTQLATATWNLVQGAALLEHLSFAPPTGTHSFASVPLGAGGYSLLAESVTYPPGSDPVFGASSAYKFSFTLAEATSVPEPGTLALLGIALFGLAGTRPRARGCFESTRPSGQDA